MNTLQSEDLVKGVHSISSGILLFADWELVPRLNLGSTAHCTPTNRGTRGMYRTKCMCLQQMDDWGLWRFCVGGHDLLESEPDQVLCSVHLALSRLERTMPISSATTNHAQNGLCQSEDRA